MNSTSKNTVTIVDYGMGNLQSVNKAFKRIGVSTVITSNPKKILTANKILLPGVGNFKKAIDNINARHLLNPLKEAFSIKKTPVLGICLGMQLLVDSSEEGDVEGLGMIRGKTVHIKNIFRGENLIVPHIGWNTIEFNNSPLWDGINFEDLFYFVHSYIVQCDDLINASCKTEYGDFFHSGIQKEHIFGVQFHPEKSHKAGLKILQNFSNY